MNQELEETEIDFVDADELREFDPEFAARELITFAVDVGATDAFLTDDQTSVEVSVRRMGRLETVQRLSSEAGRRLQNHFRAVSGAYVTDQLKPAEGRELMMLADGRAVDIRINALPNLYGYDLAMRIFGGDESIMSIDQLGIFDFEANRIRELLQSGSGLVLVSGPTGSGKTHSLYSFLKFLRGKNRKIHTIEDPIEHRVAGVVQSQVNHRAGVDFETLLAAILRHGPDVILIGEIRDTRAAEIAVRASGSGHLVVASVHARTAVGAIQSMLSYGVPSRFLANALLGVVSQRLVRRLCPHCRERYQLGSANGFLQSLARHLPDGYPRSLWMANGCQQCSDGYDRMICLPEILKVNAVLRRGILRNAGEDDLDRIATESGLFSMREAGQLRIATGWTTTEEIVRVLPSDQPEGIPNSG